MWFKVVNNVNNKFDYEMKLQMHVTCISLKMMQSKIFVFRNVNYLIMFTNGK